MSKVDPPHYRQGSIEPIDVIEDWGLGYHLGNVIKYIARAKHKGDELGDLKKASWYLGREILGKMTGRKPKPEPVELPPMPWPWLDPTD